MQDRFDPYLEWLGIRSAGRRPDYYQLLRIDRLENDVEVVKLAADGSMARVRGQRPGGHAAQWQQLLDELATAKQCLTDVTQKAAYDRGLREGSLPEALLAEGNPPHDPSIVDMSAEALFPPDHRTTPAAQPVHEHTTSTTNAPATNTPPADVPVAVPTRLPQHVAGAGPSVVAVPAGNPVAPVGHRPAQVGAAADTSGTMMASVAQQEPSRRPVVIAVVLAAVLLLAAAAAALMSMFGPDENPPVVDDRLEAGTDDQREPPRGSSKAASLANTTGDVAGPTAVSASKLPRSSPQSPLSASVSNGALKQQPSSSQPQPQPRPPTTSAKPATSEPTSGPTPVRPLRPVSPPASTLPETKPEPAAESEKPPVATPPPEAQPTPRQTAAFNRAVTEAIGALQRRDPATVKRNLDEAERNAVSQDQQDRLERVRLLQQYAGEFFKAAQAGYDSLQGDEELVIGGERMVVVDRTPKELTIRRKGRNQSFSPATMPDALTLALADHWFDQKNPTNKVFIGAFQALRGRVDVAREIWQQASRAGVSEVDFLLPVLKDIPPKGAAPGR